MSPAPNGSCTPSQTKDCADMRAKVSLARTTQYGCSSQGTPTFHRCRNKRYITGVQTILQISRGSHWSALR